MEKVIPFSQLAKAGYNRPINRRHVNEIKHDFHEDMVQPAIVSFRDGKYWIIDHQHLSTAIFELNGSDPNTPITCKVMYGLTYEQEADLYCRLNTGSKKLGAKDIIIGLIEAKEPDAVAFRDLVESCGYNLGSGNDRLAGISTAWTIFLKKDGPKTLRTILNITHSSWPTIKDSAPTKIMNGLELFLANHSGEYDRDRLIERLSEDTPKMIITDATNYYKMMGKAYSQTFCTYTQIVNRYNFNLRVNRLMPVQPV